MSVLPYPGFLYAESICELAASDVSDLNTGCLAFVNSEDAYFRLSYVPPPATPAVPNGADVVSVPGGPQTPGCPPVVGTTDDRRRWILTNIADAVGSSANALAWYINSVTGDNANIGTDPLFPVLTALEVGQRWERGAGFNTAGPVNVYIQSTSLLDSDTILVDRPVVRPSPAYPGGNPIVYHGTRRPDVATALTIIAALDINRAGNQICSVTFSGNPAALVGRYIMMTSGPASGCWARIISLDPHNANGVLTTPFVKQVSTYSTSLAVQAGLPGSLPGASFRILGDGCQVPDSVVVNIDPLAEVWFYDLLMITSLGALPYYQSLITSGSIRFFRSESSSGSPATLFAEDAAAIYFTGSSSEGFVIYSLGPSGVYYEAGYAELPNQGFVETLRFEQDTVISPLWQLITQEGERCRSYNTAVNGNAASPTLRIRGGSLELHGALYGQDNLNAIIQLAQWSQASYENKANLTVADASNVSYSGVIDYVGVATVSKTFAPATDVPFVDNATASNSQAGLIKGLY
jgi:hypothetical protein